MVSNIVYQPATRFLLFSWFSHCSHLPDASDVILQGATARRGKQWVVAQERRASNGWWWESCFFIPRWYEGTHMNQQSVEDCRRQYLFLYSEMYIYIYIHALVYFLGIMAFSWCVQILFTRSKSIHLTKGNPLISEKSRLVNYYNLARFIYIINSSWK